MQTHLGFAGTNGGDNDSFLKQAIEESIERWIISIGALRTTSLSKRAMAKKDGCDFCHVSTYEHYLFKEGSAKNEQQ